MDEHRRYRLDLSIQAKLRELLEQRIVNCYVCARTIVAYTDEYHSNASASVNVVGESADCFTDSVKVGRCFLALCLRIFDLRQSLPDFFLPQQDASSIQ